ncbi:membrane protein, partial [Streptococcus mutans 11VS1]
KIRMELAMVMLMRTLLFPVDNGMGTGLTGNGLAAEYDVWTGKITWRQLSDDKIKTQQKIASVLSIIAGSLSPLVIFSFVIVVRRLGVFNGDTNSIIFKYAPLMVGLLCFMSFELLMLGLRNLYPLVKEKPSLQQQHLYFKTMYDITIRKNDIMPQGSKPFVGTYGAFLIAFLAIPIAYHAYLHPTSFGDYLAWLSVTSVLVS